MNETHVVDNRTTKFLFWNVHRNVDNILRIIEYSESNHIDVITLCEAPEFQVQNNGLYTKLEHFDLDKERQIEVLVANDRLNTRSYFMEDYRFCTIRLECIDVNIIVVHLNSKLYEGNEELRDVDINSIHEVVKRIEERYDSKNTIIIGDFNIGLFDRQMLSMIGFNARLFRYQMGKGTSTKHGVTRDLYYNPMLSLYNDALEDYKAKGTYFYENSRIQWQCFDHILLKKPLLERLSINSLRILSSLGDYSLIRNNRPIATISDHLPIYFELMNGGCRDEICVDY